MGRVAHPLLTAHGGGGLDTDQCVMRRVIVGQQIVTIVGRGDGDPQLLGQTERPLIHGQLLTGVVGAPAGPTFAISTTGPSGTDHRQPAVVFSPEHNHYLVIWASDVLNNGAYEIMGQLINPDGQLVGPMRRYSDMGSNDTDTAFDAITPDLAWHPFLDVFTVVWAADDDLGDLSDGRFEIYGQLVTGTTGAETGANDFRITYSLPDHQGNDILEPTVAVNPGNDRWFVAFEGDVLDDDIHEPEIWMYGCTGDTPDDLGVNLSLTGESFFDSFSARNPDLTWVDSSAELVCVWDAEADATHLQGIFGRRIALDGTLLGELIEFSAGAGIPQGDFREATYPVITVDSSSDEWFVAWRGDLDDGLTHFDHEVWARRFNDVGDPVDAAAFQLSGMDPSLGPVAGAGPPAVAINGFHGYKLIAWSGDLDTTPGDEFEIFVQAWTDNGTSGAGDPPAAVVQDHEDIQDVESKRGDREEVNGPGNVEVVAEERQPGC